ncbi:methyl-accepting chemotaxis protein [Thalassomonas haliotis]|uniref:Methyl-accepting chemotaxis protein n=1 Tax=Thalassomonas haliotis TaxID=485448 RepID=A0ABY7VBE2_9GAMM|nr:methyl-accepting chemotaxis protein [Thalassomonas haliotis]WDE10967.1 methyl-accepting chemotaxis protein [Thalassomonas haliotis]
MSLPILNRIANLTIKRKLHLLFFLILASILILGLTGQYFQHKISTLAKIKSQVQDLQLLQLQLRRNEKDFLMRFDAKYPKRFTGNYQTLTADLSRLSEQLSREAIRYDTEKFRQLMQSYQDHFSTLVQAHFKKGIAKNKGLYGELRAKSHELEQRFIDNKHQQNYLTLLKIRRNEKDYMMRLELKYADQHTQLSGQLRQALGNDNHSLLLLDNYSQLFSAFSDLTTKIGLDENSGLRGELRQSVHLAEQELKTLSATVIEASLAKTTSSYLNAIILFILIALVLATAIYYMIRTILTPINYFIEDINTIKTSKEMSLRARKIRDDEIGGFVDVFNDFMNFTNKVLQQVKQLSNVTFDVQNNAEKICGHLSQQMGQSEMVASAATQLEASANEIAVNTSDTAESVANANEFVKQGQEKLKQASEMISQLSDQLVHSDQQINTLNEKSSGISDVIEVIRSIAEQTNLLALNAAIEAARAGEQGRGFSVVADEVRMLANRTQESTEQISQIISELQQFTQLIVTDTQSCKQAGLNSLESIDSTSDILGQVVEKMHQVNQKSASIATAVEQQTQVMHEVSQSIVQIKDFTEQVSTHSKSNLLSCKDVNEQTRGLLSLSAH